MRLRTWHFEHAFVLVVLSVVALYSRSLVEWLGVIAVYFSFAHAAIADRMAERQALQLRPEVECYRWSTRYFVGKEVVWVAYFVAHRSYSALVGCALFLAYPVWRKFWRSVHPIGS